MMEAVYTSVIMLMRVMDLQLVVLDGFVCSAAGTDFFFVCCCQGGWCLGCVPSAAGNELNRLLRTQCAPHRASVHVARPSKAFGLFQSTSTFPTDASQQRLSTFVPAATQKVRCHHRLSPPASAHPAAMACPGAGDRRLHQDSAACMMCWGSAAAMPRGDTRDSSSKKTARVLSRAVRARASARCRHRDAIFVL